MTDRETGGITWTDLYRDLFSDPHALASPSRHEPELLVNQERPRQEMIQIVTQASPRTVVIVSEPIGAGKTSFFYMVFNDLVGYGHCKPGELQRFSIRDIDEYEHLQAHGYKIVVMEEVDRKLGRSNLEKGLSKANKLFDYAPVVIFSGDYTLRDPSLVQLIDSPHEPIYVSLDPLTPDMLKEGLKVRFRDVKIKNDIGLSVALTSFMHAMIKGDDDQAKLTYLRRIANGKDIESKVKELDGIFDLEFLAYLIPNTKPPIATFRTTLTILGTLVRSLQTSRKPVRISGDIFGEFYRPVLDWQQLSSYPVKQSIFIQQFHDYIRRNYDPSTPLKPFGTADLMRQCPFRKPRDIAITSPADYEREIILPLVDAGVLTDVGIPYFQGGPKVQGPYLPSQETFLEVKYGPRF